MSFLDSLRAAFKGGGGPRVPLARSYVSPWSYPLWAYEPGSSGYGTRLPFEYRSAVMRGFIDNPVAQRAVRLVAEGIGGAPLAPAHKAVLALVEATSAGQPLLETLAAQLLLHGNGYVQIRRDGSGKPVELFALRPDRVTVVAGADGWPAWYQYKVGDTTLKLPVEDDDGWPSVVHLKAFHPADDHYGAGCLVGQSQKEFFVNEAHALVDALLHPAIEGEADAPPSAPAQGESWLVGDAPSGAWADQAGKLASYQAGGWIFASPREGMSVLDRATGQGIRYRDGWQRPATPAEPAGGATVDSEARAAIGELIEVLIAAGILAQS
jgi:hypothetical protein